MKFWWLHQKEVFMIFVGENLETKVAQKLFGQVWGNPGKILRTPKICLLLHLWWKGTSASVAPLLNGQSGKQARTSLGHQGWRRVFWEGTTFFKLCPLVLTYNTFFQGGLALPSYGPGGNALAMPPFSCVPVHIILHALFLPVAVSYNVSLQWTYQRSPKTEQFMTAKVSGNALKQGVEHTQCCVSAVLNCKNTRLRECLVE